MCYKPIDVVINAKGQKTIQVNCRQCLECRQKRANEWALRCMFEMKKYTCGSFITLTYEKSPLILVKKDLQDFWKRLRKKIAPLKIRYFACGEYGSLHFRPHFHAIIFGYDFPDKYIQSNSDKGYAIYNSEELEKLWGHGLVTVQDVTLNSAAYCALYSTKPPKTYPKYLWDNPEFNVMSQGLGVDMLLENIETYLETDEIWYDGKKHNIPQAVLNKRFTERQRESNIQYLMLKKKRLEKARQSKNSQISKLDESYYEYLTQKTIMSENKQKRLTKLL